MVIAKKGDFILCHRKFLGRDPLTTYEIEICKLLKNGITMVLCKLDRQNKNLISLENRLLQYIETQNDINDVKLLVEILYKIYETDEIKVEVKI